MMKKLFFVAILCLAFTTLYSQNTKTANDYKLEGKEAYKQKDYGKALAAFESAIKICKKENTPDNTLYYNAAYCAIKAKKYSKSAMYFDKSIKVNYKTSKAYLYKAISYKKLNDDKNFELTLKEGLKVFPDNYKLKKQLFNLYFKKGSKDYNAGSEILQKAAPLAKSNPKKYTQEQNKANVIFKKALPMIVKAHNIIPKNKQAIESLISMYQSLGMKDKEAEMKNLLKTL
ncbi:MAG: hypothetical protein J7J86_04080 [Bacteroidales bacterium]|nr:hypothetical protein [Bacteroidales bacterium]